MNIILIGYMGSGKSYISSGLSESLKRVTIDLDDYIEKKEEKTISEIFLEKGEIYFRKKENEYLKQCLEEHDNAIISLGGGTPCFGNNLEIVKANQGAIVYLKTSLDELVRRLYPERKKRPLIAHLETEDVLKDFIRKHLFERSYYYNQADYIITTDSKEMHEIADEIKKIILE